MTGHEIQCPDFPNISCSQHQQQTSARCDLYTPIACRVNQEWPILFSIVFFIHNASRPELSGVYHADGFLVPGASADEIQSGIMNYSIPACSLMHILTQTVQLHIYFRPRWQGTAGRRLNRTSTARFFSGWWQRMGQMSSLLFCFCFCCVNYKCLLPVHHCK